MTRNTKTAAVAEKGDVKITELEKIEPTRVDGVGTPANGFPILMMKSVAVPAVPVAAAAAPSQKAKKAKCACGDGCTCKADAKASKKAAKKAAAGSGVGKKTKKAHTGDSGQGSNGSSKAVQHSTPDVIKTAVAEANAASEERIKTLEAQLAKVLSTPIPGGPLLVTPLTQRPAANPAIKNAERLRAIAKQTTDPETARAYRELAAREEGAPIT